MKLIIPGSALWMGFHESILTDKVNSPRMVGGIYTSFLLELVVYPAIYEIWKWHFEMKRARTGQQPAAPAALPSPDAAP